MYSVIVATGFVAVSTVSDGSQWFSACSVLPAPYSVLFWGYGVAGSWLGGCRAPLLSQKLPAVCMYSVFLRIPLDIGLVWLRD